MQDKIKTKSSASQTENLFLSSQSPFNVVQTNESSSEPESDDIITKLNLLLDKLEVLKPFFESSSSTYSNAEKPGKTFLEEDEFEPPFSWSKSSQIFHQQEYIVEVVHSKFNDENCFEDELHCSAYENPENMVRIERY